MLDKKYELRYLPIFYEDLDDKLSYIIDDLKNQQAANDLLDHVEKAILERSSSAESFEQYQSRRERKYPYYRIYVDQYIIYYVVIKDEQDTPIMEIRRFLHSKQNQHKIV